MERVLLTEMMFADHMDIISESERKLQYNNDIIVNNLAGKYDDKRRKDYDNNCILRK